MASGTIINYANNSGTGYCKMPDGTMIQWGQYTVNKEGSLTQITTSGVYTGTNDFTFPKSFANLNYTVSGTARYATGYAVPIGFVQRTKDSATIVVYDFYARPMNDGNMLVFWQAIGRWK